VKLSKRLAAVMCVRNGCKRRRRMRTVVAWRSALGIRATWRWLLQSIDCECVDDAQRCDRPRRANDPARPEGQCVRASISRWYWASHAVRMSMAAFALAVELQNRHAVEMRSGAVLWRGFDAA